MNNSGGRHDDVEAKRAQVWVEHVTLHNFRGVADFRLELEPKLTLLVGRNNVGKSRVLRALAVATGGESPAVDDLSQGVDYSQCECFVDVVIAPLGQDGLTAKEFQTDVSNRLKSAVNLGTDEAPKARFGWRTRLTPSREGQGPRVYRTSLAYEAGVPGWYEPDAAKKQRLTVRIRAVKSNLPGIRCRCCGPLR